MMLSGHLGQLYTHTIVVNFKRIVLSIVLSRLFLASVRSGLVPALHFIHSDFSFTHLTCA